jgi:hypothetical protein
MLLVWSNGSYIDKGSSKYTKKFLTMFLCVKKCVQRVVSLRASPQEQTQTLESKCAIYKWVACIF